LPIDVRRPHLQDLRCLRPPDEIRQRLERLDRRAGELIGILARVVFVRGAHARPDDVPRLLSIHRIPPSGSGTCSER
jgi:hypothetical protein